MKRIYIIFVFILASLFSYGQQQIWATDSLLKHIASLQLKKPGFYLNGGFPTFITKSRKPIPNPLKGAKGIRVDCNVFYNSLIGFTLRNIREKLTPEQQILCDSILANLNEVYPHFKNNKGGNTYNFWRTDTTFIVPYKNWVTLFSGKKWVKKMSKKFKLSDDPDCTSLVLLADNCPDSVARNVHELLQHFAHDENNIHHKRKIRAIGKQYRKYGAYSSWFGMGQKVPLVFDMCVLCNILTYIQHYHLTYTKADSASLQLLIAEIKDGEYINHPVIAAPYYGRTSIILYHLARLMNSPEYSGALDSLKPMLIKETDSLLAHTNNELEKVMLSIALLKWGSNSQLSVVSGQLSVVSGQSALASVEENTMPFFIANIHGTFSYGWQKILEHKKAGIFNHYCPAFNDVLLLEYMVLKR